MHLLLQKLLPSSLSDLYQVTGHWSRCHHWSLRPCCSTVTTPEPCALRTAIVRHTVLPSVIIDCQISGALLQVGLSVSQHFPRSTISTDGNSLNIQRGVSGFILSQLVLIMCKSRERELRREVLQAAVVVRSQF